MATTRSADERKGGGPHQPEPPSIAAPQPSIGSHAYHVLKGIVDVEWAKKRSSFVFERQLVQICHKQNTFDLACSFFCLPCGCISPLSPLLLLVFVQPPLALTGDFLAFCASNLQKVIEDVFAYRAPSQSLRSGQPLCQRSAPSHTQLHNCHLKQCKDETPTHTHTPFDCGREEGGERSPKVEHG